MHDSNHPSRRSFLQSTGAGAAALTAVASLAPAALAAKSPNATIGVGCIGLGTRGGSLITQAAGIPGVKVTAVCDVYGPHRNKGIERSDNPEVREYLDYHELLADPNVDAVIIATPDHWHHDMVIDASNAGKDIYCEKGWAKTVEQAKDMLAVVKKNQTVMQLGHQARESTAGLQASELIREGVLGPVTLVRTGRFENRGVSNPFWRWYGDYNQYVRPDAAIVEKEVDWDRWLGSTPKRPFNMERFWHWRCYWDYGTGGAGDLLSHELDFVQMVLGHGIPDTCICSGYNAFLKDGREFPDTWNAVYTFEKFDRTVTFDCCMNSSSFVQTPVFHGKEASLKCDAIGQAVRNFDIMADWCSEKYKSEIESGTIPTGKPFLTFDPKKTPQQPEHMLDFFNCVRDRKKPKCNEDEAFIETATIEMSVVSYMEKRMVRWDAEKQVIV